MKLFSTIEFKKISLYIPLVLLVLLIIAFLFGAFKKNFLRCKNKSSLINYVILSSNLSYMTSNHLKDINKKNRFSSLIEISEYDIKLENKIGGGNFGEVFKGLYTYKNTCLEVAIKKLKEEKFEFDIDDELINEAICLNSINHPNVIKFYGVICNDVDKKLKYLVFEYMNLGDLLSYLRNISKKYRQLSYKNGVKIAIEIAKGCEFLEQNQIIHRDIAARNCLVHVNENINNDIIVKIGDFGLSKEMYSQDYYRTKTNKPLPIRWMSPESLFEGVFTPKSDVWSFGVVLYEIFTLGDQPYIGMNNSQVIEYIKNQGKLIVLNFLPKLEELLEKCMKYEEKKRPAFSEIVKYLLDFYDEQFKDSFLNSLDKPDYIKSKMSIRNEILIKIKQHKYLIAFVVISLFFIIFSIALITANSSFSNKIPQFNETNVENKSIIWIRESNYTYSYGCDFKKNNMSNLYTNTSRECSSSCRETQNCTHFTWDDGVCWLKKGNFYKDRAYFAKKSTICGYIEKVSSIPLCWKKSNSDIEEFFYKETSRIWIEYKNGKIYAVFRAISESNNEVVLFHEGRDFYIKLTSGQALFAYSLEEINIFKLSDGDWSDSCFIR